MNKNISLAMEFEKYVLIRARHPGQWNNALHEATALYKQGLISALTLKAFQASESEAMDYWQNPAAMQKATVAAGTSADASWASPLIALQTLISGWFASLFNSSLLDSLASQMRGLPSGIRYAISSAIATGHQTSERDWKPLTKAEWTAATTTPLTSMAQVVLSNDLVRMGGELAASAINAELRSAVSLASDLSVLAVLLNGIVAIDSGHHPRDDLAAAFDAIDLGQGSKPFIYAAPKLIKQMALWGPADGGPGAFPDLQIPSGGSVAGVPTLAIDALANYSSLGNCILVVDAAQCAGDAGTMILKASQNAAIQMDDGTSGHAAASAVSMFQTDSTVLLAERIFTISRVRPTAVAIIKNANYSIGSP